MKNASSTSRLHHALSLFSVLLLTSLGGVMMLEANLLSPAEDTKPDADDQLYKRLGPTRDRDPEKRQEQLGERTNDEVIDVSAMTGMPEEYAEALSDYTKSLTAAIEAPPLLRRRFYHGKESGNGHFPMAYNPIFDREVTIPFVLLPRPAAVKTWSESPKAQAVGWRSTDQAIERPGSVYGCSVIFDAGDSSKNLVSIPASPYGGTLSPGFFVYDKFFLKLGKVTAWPRYDRFGNLMDVTAAVRDARPDEFVVRAEFLTVSPFPENSRLRWVRIEQGKEVRRFLAYALVDGNGAARKGVRSDPKQISFLVRPLICVRHQPKVGKHDELLLPTPLGWPKTMKAMYDSNLDTSPHEDWCLDDWFPAQKDACWVIREAEDSKPLQESFLLMPASEISDRPVFFIALFAETEPKQLLKELAALHNVSADKALNSPETMARLQSLYEKIRDFPLGK